MKDRAKILLVDDDKDFVEATRLVLESKPYDVITAYDGSDGLTCVVRVRLGATGSVLLATVSRSSGNGAFDRSVETAVYKADPLPMPRSPALIDKFRSIEFLFKADNN